jgi:hypothetical protein
MMGRPAGTTTALTDIGMNSNISCHEGTKHTKKKNQFRSLLRVFVSSWPMTLLIIQMPLKAVSPRNRRRG